MNRDMKKHDYSAYDNLDNYVVISAIINGELENGSLFKVPFCGGTLVGSFDKSTITLLDYHGNTRILFIPASITINGYKYDVNPQIPDMAFESCMNIEYLVIDYSLAVSFGSCVFNNCSRLSCILQLSFGCGHSFQRELNDPVIQMDEYSFCTVDKPNIITLHTGYADEYLCDGWWEYRSWFECDVESCLEKEKKQRYETFYEEELEVLRDSRWIAELSGRIEQLIIDYSTNDDKDAFLRLLRRASLEIPFSAFFTWDGLASSVYGPDSRNIITNTDDKIIYTDLCRMRAKKSEQYDGDWERCF